MTQADWDRLEGCIGPEVTGEIRAIVGHMLTLGSLPWGAMELAEDSSLQDIANSLSARTFTDPADQAMVENVTDAISFAMAQGAIDGTETPLWRHG